MAGNVAVYILVALCGALFGIVGTLLAVIYPMNSRVSINETKVGNLEIWVPKISTSIDRVIAQNTTLIAELQACHKR